MRIGNSDKYRCPRRRNLSGDLKITLLLQASTIGVVTFAISAFGVYFGNRFGKRIDLKLDLIGGLILIGIGTKILIEHVFFS